MMNISIVGAGNVAWHLAQSFRGVSVSQVVCRNSAEGQALASLIGASVASPSDILLPVDAVLLCVSDNAISLLAQSLRLSGNPVVLHTSGATSVDALLPHADRGVLYPCQTFSKADNVNVRQTQFLIEGCSPHALSVSRQLALALSDVPPIEASSDSRSVLHCAAVFASNFTNHLLLHAEAILKKTGLPLSVLEVLTRQTIQKAFDLNPFDAQTGPARRGDSSTLERHRNILSDSPSLEIYDLLSRSIAQTYSESHSD
ncbi:MAG: DUF2520 domain-containing protein [Bacteroidales bacterium]|nr:DUF2520 domain-containing protein [Bacteroidales bacterium]